MKYLTPFFLVIVITLPTILNAQSAGKYHKAGEKFKEAEEWLSAIEQYTLAINIKPEYEKSYLSRSFCYKKTNELEKALDDYNKLKALDVNEKEYGYDAAEVCYKLNRFDNALSFLTSIKDEDKLKIKVYTLLGKVYVEKELYPEAINALDIAIAENDQAIHHYLKAIAHEHLEDLPKAEYEYHLAIKKNPAYIEALTSLTHLQLIMEKYDAAMISVNKLLAVDSKNAEGLVYRAKIYVNKLNYPNAINDLSSAIVINKDDEELYFLRGTFYQDFTQHQNAINDFSKVILLDDKNGNAYYKRAFSYEQIANYEKAIADYNRLNNLSEFDGKAQELLLKANERLFELNRESNKPQIVVVDPSPANDNKIPIPKDKTEINVKGMILDESDIKSLQVNNVDVPFVKSENNDEFLAKIITTDLDSFLIVTTDVYDNKKEVIYHIERTEIEVPLVKLLAPYASDNNEVFLDTDSPTLYLEGAVSDESLINSIFIDGVTASYKVDEYDPRFMATISIANKAQFTVSVTDVYGNQNNQTYIINREGISLLENNPMGKTWAIFIENSDYEDFPSLDGPARDISLMRSALTNYDIHNILHKQNMSKDDLERFFAIDLRDIIRGNNVKSILIWYAGHGKFVNETGYWIPTDAKRDDEFSYFSINNLKASLQGYNNFLTHTLVVSDACESGPTFYQAMRGEKVERNCGDWEATRLKSSQVFSSAGYELAIDNSQFTKTFANMLANNPNECLPIESIVEKVTKAVTESNQQKPQFGKISGLSDENGTFFFMNKK